MKYYRQLIALGVVLVVASSLYYLSSGESAVSSEKTKVEASPLYWVAPMNPSYRRDQPGKSPMGMDLVPVYEESSDEGTVKISPNVEHNLGVKLATIEMRKMQGGVDTVGYITPDEKFQSSLNAYVSGWVRDLKISSKGEKVYQGQLLLTIYSPEIVTAEQEYLLALKYNNSQIAASSKQKLTNLGVSNEEISSLEKSGQAQDTVGIYAPQSGIVTAINVDQGSAVNPMASIMTISDLTRVWVLVDVYESQQALVKQGQSVKVSIDALPGMQFSGQVDYIYPTVDKKTRTTKARIILDNSQGVLKPNMHANVEINTHVDHEVLVVPKRALIYSHDHVRVIQSLGDGKFKPVSIEIGAQDKSWVEILSGLKQGDVVVTSAHFMLDSESNLEAGFTRMDKKADESSVQPTMMQHDMKSMDSMSMMHHTM